MLRLLVALDFSESSQAALATALQIAERAGPTEILVLTVLSPQPDEVRALSNMEHAVDDLRRMVDTVRGDRPMGAGIQVRYAATHGHPAQEIATQAGTHHVDAVVLGTHGRTGLNRLLLGSVAENVVRLAPCSVLTVKRNTHGPVV